MSVRIRRASSYGAIIDVGSGSVGVGVVVSIGTESTPTIIYTHREAIRIGANPTTDDRIRAMRHALFSAVLHFNQEGQKALKEYNSRAKIDRVLLVCGAPWSHTITRLIHLKEDKPFAITHEKIGHLIKKVEEEDLKQVASVTDKTLKVHLTERAVISTMLNGYLVEDPYGKEASELTLVHISGLVPEEILSAADDIKKNIVHGVHRTVHTYALVLYCVLRDMYPHTDDAFIVDISGEATEISIMREHVLYETRSVPLGMYAFIRSLAERLHTIPEEAHAHVKEYASGNQPEHIRLAIEAQIDEYLVEINKAITSFGDTYVLPKCIFLSVEHALQPFFINVFQNNKPKDALELIETTVIVPGKKTALALSNFAEGTEEDLFLAVTGRFFHKLHGCGEIE